MAKIINDKYYTPKEIAEYCVRKTKEVIGVENISEWLEPSGGNGVFLDYLPDDTYSCDIEPEDNRIVRQDYLKLDLTHRKGRIVIGNPPFGSRMNLAKQFYKKSVEISDVIAFILPISQLDNSSSLYEFNLIYSEDLGMVKYSDRDLHCCFNIYSRSEEGVNKKPDYKLKDIEIKEYRRSGSYKKPTEWDYAICSWGNGSCGNIVKYVGQYAQEQYVIIKNEKLRDKIMQVCLNTDWKNLYNSIAGKKIQSWKMYKYFKEQIPELE